MSERRASRYLRIRGSAANSASSAGFRAVGLQQRQKRIQDLIHGGHENRPFSTRTEKHVSFICPAPCRERKFRTTLVGQLLLAYLLDIVNFILITLLAKK